MGFLTRQHIPKFSAPLLLPGTESDLSRSLERGEASLFSFYFAATRLDYQGQDRQDTAPCLPHTCHQGAAGSHRHQPCTCSENRGSSSPLISPRQSRPHPCNPSPSSNTPKVLSPQEPHAHRLPLYGWFLLQGDSCACDSNPLVLCTWGHLSSEVFQDCPIQTVKPRHQHPFQLPLQTWLFFPLSMLCASGVD